MADTFSKKEGAKWATQEVQYPAEKSIASNYLELIKQSVDSKFICKLQ